MAMTLQPTEMAVWAPGTKHYTDGTTHLAVEASNEPIPAVGEAVAEVMKVVMGDVLPVNQVVRKTVVFSCTEEGFAVDLTPVAVFPPGTTHEEALMEMGYTVE